MTDLNEPMARCDYCDEGKVTYGGHDGEDEPWQEVCTHCHGTGGVKAAPRTVPPKESGMLVSCPWCRASLKGATSDLQMDHLIGCGGQRIVALRASLTALRDAVEAAAGSGIIDAVLLTDWADGDATIHPADGLVRWHTEATR